MSDEEWKLQDRLIFFQGDWYLIDELPTKHDCMYTELFLSDYSDGGVKVDLHTFTHFEWLNAPTGVFFNPLFIREGVIP